MLNSLFNSNVVHADLTRSRTLAWSSLDFDHALAGDVPTGTGSLLGETIYGPDINMFRISPQTIYPY
jgi:hypothetical protein